MLNAIKECGQEELLLTSILIVLSESRRIRRCCFLRCLAKIPNPPTDTPLLARSNCLKEKQSVSSMKIEIIYQKDKLSIKSINDSPKLQYTFIYFKATTVNKPSSSIINWRRSVQRLLQVHHSLQFLKDVSQSKQSNLLLSIHLQFVSSLKMHIDVHNILLLQDNIKCPPQLSCFKSDQYLLHDICKRWIIIILPQLFQGWTHDPCNTSSVFYRCIWELSLRPTQLGGGRW